VLDSLKTAARVGAEGVQFDVRSEVRSSELTGTGLRQFLHRVGELNLVVAGTAIPLSHPLTEPFELDRRVEELRAALTFSYALKSRTLCCRIGRIPEDPAAPGRIQMVDVLNDLAAHSNRVGTVLCITPTDDSAETLQALVDSVTAGPIGIDFDPAHFAMTGRSNPESLRRLHASVQHVQLRDGFRGFDGGGQEAAVGHGVVDWNELLAVLGEIEYSGWLTAIRTQGDSRGADLAAALTSTRQRLLGG